MLCHESCHLNGVHAFPHNYEYLKQKAQRIAMKHYGWSVQDFVQMFGKNYL